MRIIFVRYTRLENGCKVDAEQYDFLYHHYHFLSFYFSKFRCRTHKSMCKRVMTLPAIAVFGIHVTRIPGPWDIRSTDHPKPACFIFENFAHRTWWRKMCAYVLRIVQLRRCQAEGYRTGENSRNYHITLSMQYIRQNVIFINVYNLNYVPIGTKNYQRKL